MNAEQQGEWIASQKKVFSKWINVQLSKRPDLQGNLVVNDLQTDLCDGVVLCVLMEILSQKHFKYKVNNVKLYIQKIENVNNVLDFIHREGIKIVGTGANDITQGNLKLIMGLIWTLIFKYQISLTNSSTFDTNLIPDEFKKLNGKDLLMAWVRGNLSNGYATTLETMRDFHLSWQDGLAFCAMVHRLLPDSINFSSLKKEDKLSNLNLAFETAEKQLGIPMLLDAIDILELAKPDEQSIMTYLSLFPKIYKERGVQVQLSLDKTLLTSIDPNLEPSSILEKEKALEEIFKIPIHDCEVIEQELIALQKKMEVLENNFSAEKTMRESHEKQIENDNVKIQTLESELEKLRKELQSLQQTLTQQSHHVCQIPPDFLKELENTKSKLHETQTQLESETTLRESEHKEAMEVLEKFEEELNSAKKQLSESQTALIKEKNSIKEISSKFDEKIQTLEEKLQETQSLLSEQHLLREKEHIEVIQTSNTLEEEIEALKQNLKNAQNTFVLGNNRLKDSTSEKEGLETTIQQLREALNEQILECNHHRASQNVDDWVQIMYYLLNNLKRKILDSHNHIVNDLLSPTLLNLVVEKESGKSGSLSSGVNLSLSPTHSVLSFAVSSPTNNLVSFSFHPFVFLYNNSGILTHTMSSTPQHPSSSITQITLLTFDTTQNENEKRFEVQLSSLPENCDSIVISFEGVGYDSKSLFEIKVSTSTNNQESEDTLGTFHITPQLHQQQQHQYTLSQNRMSPDTSSQSTPLLIGFQLTRSLNPLTNWTLHTQGYHLPHSIIRGKENEILHVVTNDSDHTPKENSTDYKISNTLLPIYGGCSKFVWDVNALLNQCDTEFGKLLNLATNLASKASQSNQTSESNDNTEKNSKITQLENELHEEKAARLALEKQLEHLTKKEKGKEKEIVSEKGKEKEKPKTLAPEKLKEKTETIIERVRSNSSTSAITPMTRPRSGSELTSVPRPKPSLTSTTLSSVAKTKSGPSSTVPPQGSKPPPSKTPPALSSALSKAATKNAMDVDKELAELKKIYDITGTILKVGEQTYMIGTKKVNMSIIGGFLVVRIGGGYMKFTEWIQKFGKKEGVSIVPKEGVEQPPSGVGLAMLKSGGRSVA